MGLYSNWKHIQGVQSTTMLSRLTRDFCGKQLFRRAHIYRTFGGAAAGDPSFKNAPGGYPEIKFRKDPDDYVARGNDDEAYFGGRKPGTPLEGWEYIYGAVMLILAGAMISMYNQEDTSLEVCIIMLNELNWT